MTELQTSLSKCIIKRNILYLPPISEGALQNYPEVKSALQKAGGKYSKNSFVFPSEAQPLINRLMGGDNVNIKKQFQFFATPDKLADTLVKRAKIKEGDLVLEPSAGHGAIIKALYRAFPRNMTGPNDTPCVTVDYCELMPENISVLSQLCHNKHKHSFMGDDFLKFNPARSYDKIIANPPFSKNQDIDHIEKMYSLLKPGGTIVTIASLHWMNSSNKKETLFREWLFSIGTHIDNIGKEVFKESGTNVATCILTINKPLQKNV